MQVHAALLLLLFSISNSARATQASKVDPSLFQPCFLKSSLKAECLTLSVPLDAEKQSGVGKHGDRHLDLRVAKVAASSGYASKPPLLFIAGGPGQSAVNLLSSVHALLQKSLKDRDLIAVDVRGSGASMPLDCPGGLETLATRQKFPNLANSLEELALCRKNLGLDSANFTPANFTTAKIVDDFERIRALLLIETWAIYAVSYGTRVALDYARRYPAAIERIILEGAVGPGYVIGRDYAKQSAKQLKRIAAECRAQSDCRAEFGDVEASMQTLMARIRIDEGTVNLPLLGKRQRLGFEVHALADAIFTHLYSPELWSTLPLKVDLALKQGDFAPLFAFKAQDDESDIALGLYLSIACQEDVPHYAQAAEPDASTAILPSILPDLVRTCEVWLGGSGSPIPVESAQLKFDRPVLILSGEHDPATPPEYGSQLAKGLPSAEQIVFKGMGHNVIQLTCARDALRAFLSGKDRAGPETLACAQKSAALPYFSSIMGFDP